MILLVVILGGVAITAHGHVETTLQSCAAGEDTVNISVALQIVRQSERVPYSIVAR